jgi:hypothetical protein
MNLDTEDEIGGAGATANDDQQPSLRETLEAEFAKASEPPTFDAGTGKEVTAGRARDESGRFATKAAPADDAGAAAAPAQATPQPTGAGAAAAPADQQQAAAPAEIPAPHTWTAEAKAKWNDVPPEVRRYIAEREDQMHRAISRNDEERNLGRAMSQTLQPHMETMRAIGVAPDQAVAGLLNVDAVLRRGSPEQKLEMVHEIMRSYQIPLEHVMQHQPMPQDPRLGALQQELQALRSQVTQGTQQQQEALETRAAQAEIEAFKVNAPHLEAVRDHMSQLLTNGLASGLQDAYDQAVWMNPTTRQAMLAQQTAAASKAQRVASARNAGSSISGAPGGVVPNPPTQKRSLRDELAANFGEAKSRI